MADTRERSLLYARRSLPDFGDFAGNPHYEKMYQVVTHVFSQAQAETAQGTTAGHIEIREDGRIAARIESSRDLAQAMAQDGTTGFIPYAVSAWMGGVENTWLELKLEGYYQGVETAVSLRCEGPTSPLDIIPPDMFQSPKIAGVDTIQVLEYADAAGVIITGNVLAEALA